MEFLVKKSNRKTISILVDKNCNVIIRCPYSTPQHYINEFVRKNTQWINQHIATQKLRQNSPMNRKMSAEEETQLRQKASQFIPLRIKYFSKLIGVKPNKITITNAQTRFGSCSSKNNLSFSFRLMLYPSKAIDYVIVHELSHIKEKNHSKAFYEIVAKVMPDYKEQEKILKTML